MKTAKEIMKSIALVRASGDKFNILVHETALAIFDRSLPESEGGCGDCSLAQELVNNMPKSMRRTMLIMWFSKFSPIIVKSDESWKSNLAKSHNKAGDVNPLYVPFNREAAIATPWYELANENPESAPLSIDKIEKMIEALAKKFEKAVEEDHVASEAIPYAVAYAKSLRRARHQKIIDSLAGASQTLKPSESPVEEASDVPA